MEEEKEIRGKNLDNVDVCPVICSGNLEANWFRKEILLAKDRGDIS